MLKKQDTKYIQYNYFFVKKYAYALKNNRRIYIKMLSVVGSEY